MKITNTITAYPPSIGGAQIHQHILNQHLSYQHQIQVVSHWDQNRNDWLRGTTLNAPQQNLDYNLDGIDVHRIGISNIDKIKLVPYVLTYYFNINFNTQKIAKHLQKYLDPYAQKSHLIHNVRVGREGLSYASYYAAQKYDIPFVFTPLHHPKWVGWRYQTYINLYQKADALIALTPAEKEILIQLGVKADKIIVTGIGPVLAQDPDPNLFIEKNQINNPFVLFLGQHYLYKGYRDILQATSLVWAKNPNVDFVFIGPPVKDSEKYFELFKDSRIHRLGKVDLQTKTNALSACHLLCVPSTQESFGGIYTEAWSFKKPVIGCPIPAVSNVITEGQDGLLVEQRSGAIADAICTLLMNSSLAEKMGKAGYNKVQQKFTWQVISDKINRLYTALI